MIDPAQARDIYMLAMDGSGTPVPYLVTDANERSPEFAPDGRWIAYTSDLTGRDEVYVRPYPGPGRAAAVSVEGGREPIWSASGRRLYYRGRGRIWAVDIAHQGEEVQAGTPIALFADTYQRAFPAAGMRGYDRRPDGRFLMLKRASDAPDRMRVTEHWQAAPSRAGTGSGAQ